MPVHPEIAKVRSSAARIRGWARSADTVIRRAVSILDEPALVACCRDNAASYKAPWKVVFVDTLPTNAGGKVQKLLL